MLRLLKALLFLVVVFFVALLPLSISTRLVTLVCWLKCKRSGHLFTVRERRGHRGEQYRTPRVCARCNKCDTYQMPVRTKLCLAGHGIALVETLPGDKWAYEWKEYFLSVSSNPSGAKIGELRKWVNALRLTALYHHIYKGIFDSVGE